MMDQCPLPGKSLTEVGAKQTQQVPGDLLVPTWVTVCVTMLSQALRRWQQDDQKFKDILGYISGLRLAWDK